MTARLALFAAALVGALAFFPGAASAAAAAGAPAKEKDKDKSAAKAPAKGEKAATAKGGKAKKAEAPPPQTIIMDGQPAGDDPEFAKAGKVIEFDNSGKAKVVRGSDLSADVPQGNVAGEELPPPMEERQGPEIAPAGAPPGAAVKRGPGDLTAQDGCRLRLKAQCQMLVRCSGGAFPIDCAQMAAGCDDVEGMAPYSKKDAEACAKGIGALSCSTVQAMGLNFDPEGKVPACKAIKEAEGERPAPKPTKGVPGAGQDFRDLDIDLGGVLGGGSE
ncbi:MAG TPA: hypothetical protein VGK67_16625 [Myxococcales bacterium]|jgi:hypothetical protein